MDRLSTALADRYRIESELGQGGMATVYLAADLKHDRKVALKVLRPELAAVLGADRFVQEIKTTANLQHPHILPLFDSGEADTFLYYVMPYIEGETLRAKLDRETQLGIDESIKIATEIADALDYAHRQGVIHRDIKPENILLHDGRPMVADFGIALAVSAAAGGRMTETGLSLGTPHYMSPEQATAEKDLTARADIYSLGSVLYEMLAGEPPHLGNSAQQIIMKIIADEARPITDLRKSVPPHVAAAVAQSLERLPADRFVSAAEFASALTDGRFTRPTTSAARMPESKTDWRHRIAVPAVATALVLLGVAAWGWLRSTPDRTAAPGWRVNVALPDSAQLYGGPSLSPDGSVMVYGGENGIWLRAAGTTTPIPIPGTEEGTSAALSPDGRHLAFLDAAGGVRVIPAGGGTARLVGNANLQSPIGWTDDDHVVFGTLAGLVRQPAAGGEPLQFTRTDTASGEAYHVAPSVIPDDRGVVFTVMGAGSYDSTWIAIVGPSGGDHVRLMPGIWAQYAHPNHLLVAQRDGIVAVPFDPGRRQLAGTPIPIVTGLRPRVFTTVGQLAVSHSGRLVYVAAGGYNDLVSKDVTLVDREGLATTVAPGWSGYFQTVALSPDRRRVAVGVYTEGAEAILVRDLGSGATARIAMAGYQLRDVVFDRTGSTLYFAALGVGDPGIYRADLTGASAPVLATPSGVGHIAQPTISPSGDRLFYSRYDDPRIFAARLESHVVDTFPRPPDGRVGIPQPSPDGRWLAYRSTESGESEIYVRSTDPSRSVQWQVSQGGVRRLTRVRWAPDGSELFYVAYDTMRAVRVSIDPTFETHTQEPLFSMAEFAYAFDVASDGRFVMLRRRPDLREPTELVMLERWLDLLPEEN